MVEHGRRGLSVAPIEPSRMRELYQLRAAIDGLACRLAAERVARRRGPGRGDRRAAGNGLAPATLSHRRAHPRLDRGRRRLPSEHLRAVGQCRDRRDGCGAMASFQALHGDVAVDAGGPRCASGPNTPPSPRHPVGRNTRAAESAATHHAEKAGAALYQRLKEEAAVQATRLAGPDPSRRKPCC